MPALIVIAVLIFAITVYFIDRRTSMPSQENITLKQDSEQIKSSAQKTSFFEGIFDCIEEARLFEINARTDLAVYVLYKAKLCFLAKLQDLNFDDETALGIVQKYDLLEFLSFDLWTKNHYQDDFIAVEFFLDRIDKYNKIMESSLSDAFLMDHLTQVFMWLIENGWEKDEFGHNAYKTTEDFELLDFLQTTQQKRRTNPHEIVTRIVDVVDIKVFEHIEKTLDGLVGSLLTEG